MKPTYHNKFFLVIRYWPKKTDIGISEIGFDMTEISK